MIDIYDEVYSAVAKELRDKFSGIFVTGDEETFPPKKLPCVAIIYADNYFSRDRKDSSLTEKYSNITLDVRVYSSREAGKRKQARDIAQVADQALFRLNFTRDSFAPQTSLANGTIFWTAARYIAETDGKNIYGRT